MAQLTDNESSLNRIVAHGIQGKNINFGPYRGTPWTQVPLSYLRDLVDDYPYGSFEYDMAKKLIKKRGYTDLPPMTITRHAVDRFSTRCLDVWERYRKKEEGIYTCLHRLAVDAYNKNPNQKEIADKTIVFIFKFADGKPPLLATVYRNDGSRKIYKERVGNGETY